MKLNHTADPEFLAEFSNGELSEYLERLTNARSASRSAEATRKTHPDPETAGGVTPEPTSYSISAPGVSSP